MTKLKLFCIAATLFILLGMLTGCVESNAVDRRAIIQVIGMDYQDGKFKATLEFFESKGGGDQLIDITQTNSRIATGEGITVNAAISKASFPNGKVPFYAQSSFLILGRELAEEKMDNIMEFVNHDIDLRVDTQIYIADGRAEDVISDKVDRGVLPGEFLERMNDVYFSSSLIPQVQYYQFANHYYSNYLAAALPLITTEEINQQEEPGTGGSEQAETGAPNRKMAYKGVEIIQNKQAVGSLDLAATRGMLWLTDQVSSTGINTVMEDGTPLSMDVLSSETIVKPVYKEDGGIRFEVRINNVVNLWEYKYVDLDSVNTEEYQKLDSQIAQIIEQECRQAWEQAVLNYHADIFGYGDRLRSAYPALGNWLDEHWEETLPQVELKLEIHNRIE